MAKSTWEVSSQILLMSSYHNTPRAQKCLQWIWALFHVLETKDVTLDVLTLDAPHSASESYKAQTCKGEGTTIYNNKRVQVINSWFQLIIKETEKWKSKLCQMINIRVNKY